MKANWIYLLGIAAISGLTITSCEKEQLSEWQTTNDEAVYYRTSVQPMIDNYCIECHDASSEVPLYSYESVVDAARSGRLQGSLTGAPGFRKMPENTTLDSATVNTVLKWIEQGYLE